LHKLGADTVAPWEKYDEDEEIGRCEEKGDNQKESGF
jgi:hypothetical protein